jgi:ABC-2 type transport system permease protein
MSRILAIFKREYNSYFRSPIGYVIFAIFMAISGLYYGVSVMNSYSYLAGELDFLQTWLFFLLIPIMTMRAFSEDRRNGTEVLLFTSPASSTEIVLGKYLASLGFFLTISGGTLVHLLLTLAFGGRVDIGVLGAYIGYVFLGAAFIAIGVFASALTENQIIAAVISFVILMALMLIDAIAGLIGDAVSGLLSRLNVFDLLSDLQIDNVSSAITAGLKWINPYARLSNFVNGIFEISPIIFFISLAAVFLYMTNRVIEKRRWSQR